MTRQQVLNTLRLVGLGSGCRCPAHSHGGGGGVRWAWPGTSTATSSTTSQPPTEKEYAVEMASSNLRYGVGVTQEVGMDLQNMRARNVCVITDNNIAKLDPMQKAIESLEKNGIKYDIFEDVRIEPTDYSFKLAVDFAFKGNFDAFLAVGGGSVIDTAKVANLMLCHPESDMFDFVNAPLGKGQPIKGTLKPLIAIPTTAGTGSETTGVAVFDYVSMRAKTGIANRALRPTLGLVDPNHVKSMPERVAANTAYDVLCHAIESYTALPYTERIPRPINPIDRPAYQGSNPISDVWSLQAMRIFAKYGKRGIFDEGDVEARSQLHLASAFAGIGFGNAGVHLCHGMSYPISGMVKNYKAKQYNVDHPLIPHGLSVILTSPAVFQFTAPACPERHLIAAEILGCDVTNIKREDAGNALADQLRKIMYETKVENGLSAVGFTSSDIPELVKGTLPQHRVTKLSPRSQTEDDLAHIFEKSLTIF